MVRWVTPLEQNTLEHLAETSHLEDGANCLWVHLDDLHHVDMLLH